MTYPQTSKTRFNHLPNEITEHNSPHQLAMREDAEDAEECPCRMEARKKRNAVTP